MTIRLVLAENIVKLNLLHASPGHTDSISGKLFDADYVVASSCNIICSDHLQLQAAFVNRSAVVCTSCNAFVRPYASIPVDL